MKHFLAATLLGIVSGLLPLSLFAQNANDEADENAEALENSSEESSNRRFWQAELPGGSYTVSLDRICAIGKHEYVVDGGFVVTEITIDTVGSVVARFYYGEPYMPKSPAASGDALKERAKDMLNTAKDRTGAIQADQLVVKNYPTTTHAKTIEFRLARKENIEALFESVNKAWSSGKGVKFTVKSE